MGDEPTHSDSEHGALEDETLKRLLARPPDHKTKAKSGASPKKRGRPPKLPIASDK
jgi:hypothetical protein